MMDPIPCHFYEDGQRKDGTLQLEENHLVFQTGRFKDKTAVPYQMIKAAQQDDQQRLISQIDIITKSFKKFTIDVVPGPLGTILTRVNGRSKAPSLRELPAFKMSKSVSVEEWDEFTLETEYAMMKVPNNEWKITELNKNFELCSTYPKVLAVPTTATDFIIQGSAKFRSRQRLPILTYLHGNGGSIVRCAQPMAGANNRSEMDEKLLELCVDTSRSRSNGLIVDTRPMINAMANRAQGKGYENVEHYQKCSFEFHGIENIHVMRKSLESLEQKGWLSSDWLKHIYAVLDVSNTVKKVVQEGRACFVHCSDGWDRTSQVCAGAALMLCPRYRTFTGFLSLIHKDWISFGHKCADRLNLSRENSDGEASPIFLQFLEFVYQLMQQFPQSFEFTSSFLIEIYEKAISCTFGDFCGNSIKQREELGVFKNTKCLLNHLSKNREKFRNHLYQEFPGVLEPEVDMCFIKFWSEMYHATRENLVNDAIEQLVRENDSLRETVKMLEEAVNGHSEKNSALESKNDEPPPIQKSTSGLLGPL